MMPRTICYSFLILGLAVATAFAQDESMRQAESPYQEEMPYRFGENLEPAIDIEGVRWQRARLKTKDGEAPEAGRQHTILAELEFDNQRRGGVTLTVVLLLQDENGGGLQRLASPEYRLGGNKSKVFKSKFTVSGDDLLATRSMYLFCRVE